MRRVRRAQALQAGMAAARSGRRFGDVFKDENRVEELSAVLHARERHMLVLAQLGVRVLQRAQPREQVAVARNAHTQRQRVDAWPDQLVCPGEVRAATRERDAEGYRGLPGV